MTTLTIVDIQDGVAVLKPVHGLVVLGRVPPNTEAFGLIRSRDLGRVMRDNPSVLFRMSFRGGVNSNRWVP